MSHSVSEKKKLSLEIKYYYSNCIKNCQDKKKKKMNWSFVINIHKAHILIISVEPSAIGIQSCSTSNQDSFVSLSAALNHRAISFECILVVTSKLDDCNVLSLGFDVSQTKW